MLDLNDVKKIHFIGIGGIGMSALARHFLAEGISVSGSDRSPSPITEALESEGAHFFPAQVGGNITSDIDLVVYTEAMPDTHEELVAARTQEIPLVNYFQALGLVANDYFLIAIAGSHGKTTTTAMLIDIFEDAGLDPSAVVGSLRSRTGKNYRRGKSKYFIVEACEYKRDFLHLEPDILVITNVEEEHLDYYRDLDDVVDAFHTLAAKVPEDGAVVCNANDPVIRRVVKGIDATVVDYTKEIDLLMPMKLPGMHSRMNAAAALTVSLEVEIPSEAVKKSLQEFASTWRRFEYKGTTKKGAAVYDDYAHHPSEIRATLEGTRELYPDKNIMLVYQPHMYSRTHALFNDFVEELSKADEVVLLPIYAAREINVSGVTSEDLVKEISVRIPAKTVEVFDDVIIDLQERMTANDVIIVMGAGDVYQIAERITS